MVRSLIKLIAVFFAISSAVDLACCQTTTPTAEEIIQRHIESLGNIKERERNRNRMAVGSSLFEIHGIGQRSVNGNAVFASDSKNLALVSTFEMQDYRMERIGLFDNKIEIPFVDAGRRSPLGSFLMSYDKLLSSRILGGAIFSTWLFGELGEIPGRLHNTGKKKLNGRDVWVIEYSPKSGLPPGAYIKLYFDAENYHHVRTVYAQKETEPGFYNTGGGREAAASGGGIREWTNEMASNSHTLTEDFDQIDPIGGLALPFKYNITLSIDSYKGTAEFTWKFVIREYKFVKDFPKGTFTFKSRSSG